MRVLYVCTANICRSASAARLLADRLAADPILGVLTADVGRGVGVSGPAVLGIDIRSAGTHALVGASGCSVAPALATSADTHTARALTPALIGAADLVLAAARDHRAVIVAMDHAARPRTFTIRQAGRIAAWLTGNGMVPAARERAEFQRARTDGARPEGVEGAGLGGSGIGSAGVGSAGVEAAGVRLPAPDSTRPASTGDPAVGTPSPRTPSPRTPSAWAQRFAAGDPRAHVLPLPSDPEARWRWMVAEMDAARGMAVSMPAPAAAPARRWRFRGSGADPLADVSPDDVPDPHVRGTALHAVAYEQIVESTDALLDLMRAVAAEI